MTSKVTISDHRIKENVVDIDEVVDLLRPVMYFNEKTKREQLGFIAQEVESVFPFLVTVILSGMFIDEILLGL